MMSEVFFLFKVQNYDCYVGDWDTAYYDGP